MDFKVLGINLLVIVAGVLIAFKVKEQMDKARVSAPTK
jgi:hypothetical protein